MFGDYSIGDLGSIFVMQGFAGLILFSVYVLMALGLAIIFGQMGVINMAHGEFIMAGCYTAFVVQKVIANAGVSLLVSLALKFWLAGRQARHVHAHRGAVPQPFDSSIPLAAHQRHRIRRQRRLPFDPARQTLRHRRLHGRRVPVRSGDRLRRDELPRRLGGHPQRPVGHLRRARQPHRHGAGRCNRRICCGFAYENRCLTKTSA